MLPLVDGLRTLVVSASILRDKLSQREKFIRTAREVGADETGETLDETLRAIGRAWKR